MKLKKRDKVHTQNHALNIGAALAHRFSGEIRLRPTHRILQMRLSAPCEQNLSLGLMFQSESLYCKFKKIE